MNYAVGAMILDTVPWQAPIARAVTAGTLSVDAAESIRAGLGQIDAAVTAEKLGAALEALLASASSMNADEVFKRARRIQFGDTSQIINVGRDERLFTEMQRAAMAVRDGGCLCVDGDRSPAWSEAHHINERLKDNGYTDLADGVLLCPPHHLLLHNQHWAIIRTGTQYWLRPPADVDPEQTLIALPSKRVTL